MRGRVVGRPGPDRDVHSCNTLWPLGEDEVGAAAWRNRLLDRALDQHDGIVAADSRARDVGARESMRGMVGGPAAGEAEVEGQRAGRDKQAVAKGLSNLGIVKLEGGRERTDAINFAPIPSLNLCSRRSSPARLHTPYWRSPSAPNPRTLAVATLPAMRINASRTAMGRTPLGRTPLLPFASGTRIEAVRSSTQLGGREAEKRRLERRVRAFTNMLCSHAPLQAVLTSSKVQPLGPGAEPRGKRLTASSTSSLPQRRCSSQGTSTAMASTLGGWSCCKTSLSSSVKASGGRASRAAAALESRPSLHDQGAGPIRTAVWSLYIGGRRAGFSRGLASDGGSGQSPSAKAKRAARVLGTCPFPLGKERQRADRLSSRLRLSILGGS